MGKYWRPLIFLTGLSLASCANNDREHINVIEFGRGALVAVDSIRSDSLLNPVSMIVADESLIIVNDKTEKIFEKISIKDFTNLGSFGMREQGPGEYNNPRLDAIYQYSPKLLAMKEGGGEYIDIIDSDNLTVIDRRPQTFPDKWQYFQYVMPIDENLSLAQNGLEQEWAIIDRDGSIRHTFPVEVPQSLENLADNDFARILVKTSKAAISPDKKVIAIAYTGFPVVEFYDANGNHIGKIEGDINNIPKLGRWLFGICPTADGLYVAYHNPEEKENEQSALVYSDWSADIKSIYTIPKKAANFAVDEESERIFFVTSGDSDYVYYFTAE